MSRNRQVIGMGADTLDLYELKPGDKVRTTQGALVQVLSETEDGRWIKVRYIESPQDPALTGTEDLCHEDELKELAETNMATE